MYPTKPYTKADYERLNWRDKLKYFKHLMTEEEIHHAKWYISLWDKRPSKTVPKYASEAHEFWGIQNVGYKGD